MKVRVRIFPLFLLFSLFISACGTLQVSVYQTPTADVTIRQTLDTLAVQNAALAAGAESQPTPPAPGIGQEASSEEIRARLITSHQEFQSAWADGVVRTYPVENPETDPIQVTRFQIWADQPGVRLRVMSGPEGEEPSRVTILDGTSISTWTFPAGQVETFAADAVDPLGYYPGSVPDAIEPHPFSLLMGIPAGDALFPAPLAQRGGSFVPIRPESAAGRPALVVDWWGEADTRIDRFWIDTETGVVLRWQNFGKGGGETVSTEIEFNSILFDQDVPAQLFDRQLVSAPQYSEGPSGIPSQTAQSGQAPVEAEKPTSAGQITFAVRDNIRKRIRLVSFPGDCLLEGSTCPALKEIPGYPNRLLSRVDPLVWSPGGERAALISGERSFGIPARLYLYEKATDKWTELYEADTLIQPVWSEDGLRISAGVIAGGRIDLVIFSLEGSKPENLTRGSYSSEESYMYPLEWLDTNTLIFSLTEGTSTSIYQVDTRNGEKTLLVRVEGKSLPPSLSPDGGWLAGVSLEETSSQLEITRLDGSGAVLLASYQFSLIQQISWSPDSSRLAFVTAPQTSSNRVDVYTIDRQGAGLQQVYSGMAVGGLVWSPDGQHLLVAGQDRDNHFYVYHADLTAHTTEILQAEGLGLDQDWLAPAWYTVE